MSKIKLSKQIENFSSMASFVSPLCSKYTANSIKPFLSAAQVYNENYRSKTEFTTLLRAHQQLLHGSISICNRLFDNYEAAKQNAIYDWSNHFFNLLKSSKLVIDDAYRLAYTVGRTDQTTKQLIDTEKNPLVKIQRKVILEDGEYDTYKKTMHDWKCNVNALYVEEQYMNHIVEMCNTRKSQFNPTSAQMNVCTLRRSIIVPDRDFESTPRICVLNAELLSQKHQIEEHEKNGKLTTDDIDNYIRVYNHYQRELIAFTFTNFSRLYNEKCIQCIKIFLEQQHSIVYNLLKRRKKIISTMVENDNEKKRLDEIAWTDIDKNTYISQPCSGENSNSCINQTKVVGSLQ